MEFAMLGLILFLLFAQISFSEDFCIDNKTLQRNFTMVIGDEVIPISKNITCNYGCNFNTNMCNPPSFINYLIIIAIIVFVILIFKFYYS